MFRRLLLPSGSITVKLTGLLLASMLGTLLAVASYYGYVRRNDDSHLEIVQSLSDRCRVLHRRIDTPSPLTTRDRNDLRDFVAAAEPVMVALERGGPVAGRYRAPLPTEIGALFTEATGDWPQAQRQILALAAAEPENEAAARERLHRVFPQYQAAIDRVAKAMGRRSLALREHMRTTLLLIVSVNGVFLLTGLCAARRFIVGPVLAVERAARRVAAGEYSHVVPVASDDEIGRLAGSFNRMSHELATTIAALRSSEAALARKADELEKVNVELEQYAYAAAHDLQEPLRTVTTYSQMLRVRCQAHLSPDGITYLSFLEAGAARMRGLVRDLLSYSRAAHQAETRRPVDCNTAVDAAMANCGVAIDEMGAKVRCEPLPAVLAEPTEIELVFQNLISNAIKYRSEEPPEVEITSEIHGDTCTFRVRDNGIGIDPAYHDRIFGLFKRLHGMHAPGTGVGLALTRKIIEKHGGRIWVESELGHGATFVFTLPLAEVAVPATAG